MNLAPSPLVSDGVTDRARWVALLERIARPVLEALAAGQLKRRLPMGTPRVAERAHFAYLEVLARTLVGLAPWLESGDGPAAENAQRDQCRDLARQAIESATNPASPDFVNFHDGHQPIVDAAFLSHAFLRAPMQLWSALPAATRERVLDLLEGTRNRRPYFNNWLLFSAMVEVHLRAAGRAWDRMRVDYALRQHEQWYKGDGVYGDGPEYRADYYNSFVIQPMLVDIIERVAAEGDGWERLAEPILRRAVRYAELLERQVSPEGTFPPVGRSIAYRCGAFQHLAQMALRRQLPAGVRPAQVRGALTAVIRRVLEAPGTFDAAGWLTVGLAGHQPSLGENYICVASTYLCTTAFLPLGLPASDPFWSDPPAPWTSVRLWSGEDLPADHSLGSKH